MKVSKYVNLAVIQRIFFFKIKKSLIILLLVSEKVTVLRIF